MRRFFCLSIILTTVLIFNYNLIANGFNMNSNGSKAIGMGGAFVGLADDYSAVFWNPAGLTQMKETTLSLFFMDVNPTGVTYQFSIPGLFDIDAKAKTTHHLAGGLGFFKPLSDRVVIGIYAHIPSGMGANWNGSDLIALSEGTEYNWKSLMGIIAVSPSIAFQISDQFSIGAAVNINYGLAKLERPGLGQYEEDIDGIAIGATLGMLFKPSEKISLGLSFKTPYKVTLKGEASMSGAPLLGLPETDEAQRKISFPLWLAAGIAIKPSDKFTFTADVQYSNWDNVDIIEMEYSDPGWKLFFEESSHLRFFWKDAVQFRLGMEYKMSSTFAIRAGYYYDPSPGPKHTQTIMVPQHSFNWVTFGLGFDKKNVTIDFAVEYGIGKKLEIALDEVGLTDPGMPGTHQMNMFVPTLAITFKL